MINRINHTPNEVRTYLLDAIKEKDFDAIEKFVDAGIRHDPNAEPQDYINHWVSIGRAFAYATHDYSYGEFEKEFAIIIRRLLEAEESLNWQVFDEL